MKTCISLKNRQGGAVAVMVGFSLVLLIGFLAMVIDLGHLYVAKTGLQNAADAAALSGAKQLNGTKNGVNKGTSCTTDKGAVQCAIEAADKNSYDFSSNHVDITIADIWVGACPDDSCMVAASSIASDADAAGMTFLKVHTRNRSMATWFAPIWGILNTSTYGMAVAGRYVINISPMGVCAIDKSSSNTCHGTNTGPGRSVSECAFLRGVAYNLPNLNPINNGDPIWINPVDSYPGPCDQNHGNTPTLIPFLCTGRSATVSTIPAEVWVNTGAQAVMNGPLNSRFGDPAAYNGTQSCSPVTAPADLNVKEYFCTYKGNGSNPDNCVNSNPGTGLPQDWIQLTVTPANDPLNYIPTQQSVDMLAGNNKQGKPFYAFTSNGSQLVNLATQRLTVSNNPFSRYGPLWSFTKERTQTTGSDYSLADWPTLYGGSAVPSSNGGYPASGVPYTQTTGNYYQAPTGVGAPNATANRRVLNVAIIDCAGVQSLAGQSCVQHLPVLAVGKFFMQRKSNLPGSLIGEFAGLVDPLPPADIRLYR